MRTTEQVLLAGYTTLRLGGPAARFTEAASQDELITVVRDADRAAEPVLVLGGGSNLVVADEGFPGTVVLAGCEGVEISRDGELAIVTAAAGEDWDGLVRQCIAAGLSGVECLSGIPGRTGATPIQNVGAYGQEVAQTVTSVRAYDRRLGQVADLPAAECGFGYRSSMFKRQAASDAGSPAGGSPGPAGATGRFVVLSVTFALPCAAMSAPVRYGELSRLLGVAEGERVPLAAARAAVLELRRGKGMVLDDADPDTRSAGSFFTNPVLAPGQFAELEALVTSSPGLRGPAGAVRVPSFPGEGGQLKVPAAWLIERAGFTRGYQLGSEPGGARISTKHTLALTNPGQASTASLLALARRIRDGVRDVFGIELANEPVLVGVEL